MARLGDILVESAGLEPEQVEQAAEEAREQGFRLGAQLLVRKLISEEQLAQALARQCELPYCEVIPDGASEELLEQIPIGYARSQQIIPLDRDGETVTLIVADPLAVETCNDLAVLLQARIACRVATPAAIQAAINRAYEKQLPQAGEVIADIHGDAQDGLAVRLESSDLLDSADEAPIIRFVNSVLTQASQRRASDIHLEPFEKDLVVRFRIDGVLHDLLHPPRKAHAGIVSRIKVMANLDIAEKRLPQDGRFRVRIAGRDIDVRVSTLPTVFGERVVLRLLETTSGVLTLEQVGLDGQLLPRVKTLTDRPHGIFLVTGPTGSGKTTTLYAALSRLNTQDKNIITVEDPVEYQLDGVGQIQVNPKIDLTFANGLRSILRQDPDIIMVGEIRDAETAEIAVQAALTGHLVFSTLHTNNAAGALTRLVEMGVAPFLAASAIIGILAQRLVRRLCPECREAYTAEATFLEELGLTGHIEAGATLYRPAGCEACQQLGYRGRTGLFELLVPDETLRALVLDNKDAASIEATAVRRGMRTLLGSGLAWPARPRWRKSCGSPATRVEMPLFEYVAYTAQGRKQTGTIEASGRRAAFDQLRHDGIFPSEVRSAREGRQLLQPLKRYWQQRISQEETAAVTRQLATLLKAGLPLAEALMATAEQQDHAHLGRILREVRAAVIEGDALAVAMREHPRIFSRLVSDSVEIGERSGRLAWVLEQLAEYQEKQARLQSRLQGALAYPLLMVLVGSGVLAFLMVTVVPKVTQMLVELGQQLPLPSLILIRTSAFLSAWWWLLALLLVLLGFWLRRYLATPDGRLKWDRLQLSLPLIGRVRRQVEAARWSRTLATLLAGGMPLLAALEVVRDLTENRVFVGVMVEAVRSVREGEGLATCLGRGGIFPPMVRRMVEVGERSGELSAMLQQVAATLEHQLETTLDAMLSLIEPLLILLMGGMIGFVVLAVLLPIFQASQGLG